VFSRLLARFGDNVPHADRRVIRRGEGSNRLLIPAGAVFRQGDGWAAYVVVGGRNERDVEVLDGVGEGDRVVLYPTDKVVDGVRVEES
jgi:HlyD family secretion protein